jgi:hypothetical protein
MIIAGTTVLLGYCRRPQKIHKEIVFGLVSCSQYRYHINPGLHVDTMKYD